MSQPALPLRSVLYVPGSNARALAKTRALPADAFILDLEDAVAPDAKVAAREALAKGFARGAFGERVLALRVNGLDTPWGANDVRMAARSGAHALVVPKVNGPEDVRSLVDALEGAGAPAPMRVWCMVETPRAVLSVGKIARAHHRVGALVMGTSDLAKALRCAHLPDRTPLLASLSLCVLAARAEGLVALDGVQLDLQDAEGFERACVQGRQLGFDGKTLIHPRTIEVANRVFAPGDDEVNWARRVIAAFEEARRDGRGVSVLEGQLIETLHVDEARRTLALASAIERLGT